MKKSNLLTVVSFLFMLGTAQAQVDTSTDSHTIGINIPAVALVDIEPEASKNITMNFTAPTEAGLPIGTPSSNNNLWLNYSFIPSGSGITADVTVKLDDAIPGVDINLVAATDVGNGDGAMGTPVATLTLTGTDQNIIQNVGASYTGDGASNGHELTYSLDVTGGTSDYANLFSATNTVTITYTISE